MCVPESLRVDGRGLLTCFGQYNLASQSSLNINVLLKYKSSHFETSVVSLQVRSTRRCWRLGAALGRSRPTHDLGLSLRTAAPLD